MNKHFCFYTIIATLIAMLLIAVLLCLGYKKFLDRTKQVYDNELQEAFFVQNNKQEPEWVGQEVAKRLGIIAKRADKLIQYMEKNNLPNAQVSQRLAKRWKKIRSNPRGLRETSAFEKPAAYTVNKSEQLRICIRNPKTKQIEDLNTAMFVLLHELAHIMSTSYGHFQEFKTNFAYITHVAVQLGLYQYINYSESPTQYCNTNITHSSY